MVEGDANGKKDDVAAVAQADGQAAQKAPEVEASGHHAQRDRDEDERGNPDAQQRHGQGRKAGFGVLGKEGGWRAAQGGEYQRQQP